jgi:hypothetical protein
MLPAVKNTVIASVTAFALAITAATPTHALGKNERNFIAGAATALVINGLIRQDRMLRQQAPRHVQPRYVEPQPVYQPQPVYRTSVYNTVAAQAFNSYSRGERLAIQRQLARQGYYHSSIDGSFGPGTYNAVAAYARDIGASNRLGSREGIYGIYDGLIF